jgi:hypothetical protein
VSFTVQTPSNSLAAKLAKAVIAVTMTATKIVDSAFRGMEVFPSLLSLDLTI